MYLFSENIYIYIILYQIKSFAFNKKKTQVSLKTHKNQNLQQKENSKHNYNSFNQIKKKDNSISIY